MSVWVGECFKNKYESYAEVVELIDAERSIVVFNDGPTGIKIFLEMENRKLISKKFESPFDRVINGWGYRGHGEYSRKEHAKCYRAWKNRIYLATAFSYRNNPSYLGTGISDEFFCFQSFAKWWYSQVGCDEEDFHVDKDLFSDGYKVYSAETCCLIPPEVNYALSRVDGDEKNKVLFALAHKYKSRIEPRVFEALISYKKS